MTVLAALALSAALAASSEEGKSAASDSRDALAPLPRPFVLRPVTEGSRQEALDLFRPPRLSTTSVPVVRRAQSLMDQDRFDDAIRLLEREEAVNPGSSDVLLNLGWASWHLSRASAAERAWKLLYQLDPHNALFVRLYAAIEVDLGFASAGERLAREALELAPGDVDASLVLCKALVAQAKLPEAQAVAEELLSAHPRLPPVLYQAGEIYDLQRKFETSLPLYDVLVEVAPKDARYGRRRAEALYELDRFEEAVREWKRLIAFTPPDSESLRSLGRVYFSVQAYDEAWLYWLKLALRYPNDPAVLFLVANVQLERGRFDDALRLGRKILSLSAEDVDGTVVVARTLARLGRVGEARDLLEAYLRRHPEEPATRFQMADVLYQMGLYAEALEQYDALLRRKPGVPAYRRLRAQALFSLGRHEEALREWEALSDARPPDILSLYNLVWAYASLGRGEDAIEVAWKLVELEPRKPDGFILMSGLELDRGRPKEAETAARRALDLEPEHRDATVALARAELAQGDAASARAHLKAILPKNKYHLPLLFELAVVELADGRPEDALPLFERLGSLAPANVVYARKRAEALYDLGRYDQALVIWKKLAGARVPDRPSIERLIADAVARRDWGDADAWFDRLRRAATLTARQWMALAQVQLSAGNPSDALESADAAVLLDTAAVQPRLLRADALETLARYPEAEAIHEQALTENPDSERAPLALVRLAEAKGEHAVALERLRKAYERLGWPQLKLREARILADLGETRLAGRQARPLAAAAGRGVAVIAYGGLARFERGEGVWVETFRRHLSAMREAGYKPISLSELVRVVREGREPPSKSVLVTLDDPRLRVLEAADAALKESGWNAVVFAPLRERRPGFPGSEDFRKLRESGRWELGALDPEETERDYRSSRAALDAVAPEGAGAYAFDRGDLSKAEQAAVLTRFDVAFAPDPWGYNRGPWSNRLLRRHEVAREWTGERLVSHLMTNDPRVQATMLEASLLLAEGKTQRALRLYESLERDGVRTGELFAQKGVAYERMGFLYRASREYARAVKLEPDNARYRELYAAAMMAIGPHVEPSVASFGDNYDRVQTKAMLRFGTYVQETQVEGWGGMGRYHEGGSPGVEAREMGGHVRFPLGLRGWGDFTYTRRNYGLGDAVYDGTGRLRQRGRLGEGSSIEGSATVSLFPSLQGELGLMSSDVDSARAIIEGRKLRGQRLGLNWDVGLDWAASASGELRQYNDGNRENASRVTLMRRMSNRLSAGYAYTRSAARFTSYLYYSPLSLQQHMLQITSRPGDKKFRGLLELAVGYGVADSRARLVQSARAGLEWRFRDRFQWTIQAGYSRSPTYTSRDLITGLTVGF